MKAGELIVMVDSVEEAVKFYTERLAFDITCLKVDPENAQRLGCAYLKKGKCFIGFRKPTVQELTEFTFIKRCSSRCITLQVEMKKGIDKYFGKCKKKDITVTQDLRETAPGVRSFSIMDPFGVKLTFKEVSEKKQLVNLNVVGILLDQAQLNNRTTAEKSYLEVIATQLKKFGILRRASKKFAKAKIKELVKANIKK